MVPHAISYVLVPIFFTHHPPAPWPLAAGELPHGVVARLGPDSFRYAGYVNVMHNGGPAVWYSRDGKRVGVTSNAGAYVWDVATGKRLLWVSTDELAVAGLLGFDADGNVVVDCKRKWDDGGAGVFRIDVTTGKVTAKFQPTEARTFAAVSPDGKVVFSRTRVNDYTDSTIATEIDTGKEVWRRKHPEMWWTRVSPDGSRLVTWSSRAQWSVDVLDAATGQTVEKFAHPDKDSHPAWTGGGVAVGPKAERIVGGHGWNRGFSVFKSGVKEPEWHATGTWHENVFLVGEGKKAVMVRERKVGFDVETWVLEKQERLSAVAADVGRTMALSPDGSTLAAAADYRMPQHTLHFFDVQTGKKRAYSPEAFTQAAVVWYLPDGTLASADQKFEKPVKWDAKTGAMAPLPAGSKPPADPKPGADFKPPAGLENVVTSPDGTRVFAYRFDPDELDSSPGDTYLGLFDERGAVVRKYERPDRTGGAWYRFAPDGKTFAVARGDGTIALFDAADGKSLRTLRHGGGVSSLAFSPDGRFLATACGDGPILVWDLKPSP